MRPIDWAVTGCIATVIIGCVVGIQYPLIGMIATMVPIVLTIAVIAGRAFK